MSMLSLTILVMVLTACSQSSANSSGNSNSLSQAGELLVGTLKLEGTKNAVTEKQAASLIPLWQAYNQLSTSDSTAQAEMTALVSQIQGTMTTDQIQAIGALKLTSQDIAAAATSLAVSSSEETRTTTAAVSKTSTVSGVGSGNPNNAGGPQSGGTDPGAAGGSASDVILGTGTDLSSTPQTATPQANTSSKNGIPSSLVNALIELLQTRAGPLAG